MNCEICNHKEHEAGMCEQCNCMESEIILPRERPTFEDNFDGYQIDSYYGYDDF
jgi:hypothetical protein